jgi:anti-sigma factor RsiW
MTPECRNLRLSLEAYLDNELGVEAVLTVEAHLGACPDCARLFAASRALKLRLGEAGAAEAETQTAEVAELSAKIRHALIAEAVPETPSVTAFSQRGRAWVKPLMSPDFGAGLVAACAVMWVASGAMAPRGQAALTDELVSSHVRSLMPQHLIDVQSSDHHTVKPWFAGKLDFSPPVLSRVGDKCTLIGGRLDYVAHKDTAAMAYQCDRHVVNLYVQTTDQADARPDSNSHQGYQVVRWRQNHLAYFAVSDMTAPALERFAQVVFDANHGGNKLSLRTPL